MPVSTWTAIVARVKAQLESVPNIGHVHDGHRLVTTAAALDEVGISDIEGERRFRMWTITLASVPSVWEDQSGIVKWTRLIVVEGYLQFEDGSQVDPTNLAELVMRKLDTDVRTTRLNDLILFGGPCSLRTNEPRQFGPILCNYCKVECPVVTLETLT